MLVVVYLLELHQLYIIIEDNIVYIIHMTTCPIAKASRFSNSSLRNFDIALYYSSMEYALQRNCEIVTSVALNSACKQALQQLRARTFGAYVLVTQFMGEVQSLDPIHGITTHLCNIGVYIDID